jgi:small conductance mechanosensitive channel
VDFSVTLQQLRDMARAALELLPQLVLAALVLVVAWLASAFLSQSIARVIANSSMRRSLKELIGKFVSIAIMSAGIVAAATIAFPGITPGRLFTVLGVSSVAVGFAFKDIFENFMAGTVILFRDVIEIDDVVEHDGIVGKVEKITIRDTHLRTMEGERVILPNAFMFQDPVSVLTDRERRRQTLMCGVAYDTDLEEARQVMQEALDECDSVDAERERDVLARNLGPSSIDFEVTWWCGATPRERRLSRDEVLRTLVAKLDASGIEIPFPQRVVHLPQEVGADDVSS